MISSWKFGILEWSFLHSFVWSYDSLQNVEFTRFMHHLWEYSDSRISGSQLNVAQSLEERLEIDDRSIFLSHIHYHSHRFTICDVHCFSVSSPSFAYEMWIDWISHHIDLYSHSIHGNTGLCRILSLLFLLYR